MEYFTIKNWNKHQHYKDRRPPWIKLHQSLFDDYEFSCLQDASKLHLILIWLLASRSSSLDEAGSPKLPADKKHLQRALGLSGPIDLNPLFSSGFLVMIAGGYQDASKLPAKRYPETETETYKKETETETEKALPEKHSGDMTEDFLRFYKSYPKHEDKQDAWKAWRVLSGKRPDIATILAAIENQKLGRKWQEGFIKSPASWLRKGCWDDEIDDGVDQSRIPGVTNEERAKFFPSTEVVE